MVTVACDTGLKYLSGDLYRHDAGDEARGWFGISPVPFGWHAFDAHQGGLGGQVKNTVTKNWLRQRDLAPQQ